MSITIPYRHSINIYKHNNIILESTLFPCAQTENFLNVHNLYTLSILTETFKIKKLHTPSLLNELLPLIKSSRLNLLLKVQMNTNLSVTQHNFIYKAAQVWNKIIPKILNSPEFFIIIIIKFTAPSNLIYNRGQILI